MKRILVDKETGEEFGCFERELGYMLKPIPKNPMPELEVGDWYQVKRITDTYIYVFADSLLDRQHAENSRITEIRKANGVIWKK